jgi:hypothetical protein
MARKQEGKERWQQGKKKGELQIFFFPSKYFFFCPLIKILFYEYNFFFFSNVYVNFFFFLMYSINFFFPMGALGWGVALAQGLAGLTPGPALYPPTLFVRILGYWAWD